MKIPSININLLNYLLSLNGKKTLTLEDSLLSAEISKVLNAEDETALELRYNRQNEAENFISDEAEKIYLFLEENLFADKIAVNFYPELDFPTIALVGKYKATFSN